LHFLHSKSTATRNLAVIVDRVTIDTQITLIFKQPRLAQLHNRDACEKCFFFLNSWKGLQA